jgi:hypothetical protein
VSGILSRPRSGVACAEVVSRRRWPIWAARFAVTGGVAVSYPVFRAILESHDAWETLLLVGLTFLVLLVPFIKWSHETIYGSGRIPKSRLVRTVATFAASCVAIWMFLRGAQADAVHLAYKAVHPPRKLMPAPVGADGFPQGIGDDQVDRLPRFSAKLTGAPQAPVSLIFLGTGLELLDAFVRAGWYAAERITVRTCLRAFGRGVLDRPYLSAPVLPAFLEGKLHDIAFQRTDDGGSSRRRHHARWWLTDFVCEGKPVWVATASYDAGVGICRVIPLPIHHIHPDLDAERDYIAHSLANAGSAQVLQELRVTEPMTGRNAAGDHFYTQGKALVLA